jgi:hypothetical protein
MDDTEPRAKRSRFDQTEPEPRRSRFDRRSRSPPARKPDSGRDRDRSPLSRSRDTPADSKSPPIDPAAAAGKLSSEAPGAFSGRVMLTTSHSCGRRPDQCAAPGPQGHPARRCSPGSIKLRFEQQCCVWPRCRRNQPRGVHLRRRLHQGYRGQRLAQQIPPDEGLDSENGNYSLVVTLIRHQLLAMASMAALHDFLCGIVLLT